MVDDLEDELMQRRIEQQALRALIERSKAPSIG
jgi:hypothetical protein